MLNVLGESLKSLFQVEVLDWAPQPEKGPLKKPVFFKASKSGYGHNISIRYPHILKEDVFLFHIDIGFIYIQ